MSGYVLFDEIYVEKRWEFKQVLCQLVGMERYYVMRGQVNAEWDIRSRLERKLCLECIKDCKDFMINRSDNHPKLTSSSENETLAKLQHYGGITNMIDFTHSFINALYFGIRDLEKKHENKDFAIWLVLMGDTTFNPKINFLPLWRVDKEGAEGDYQVELDLFQYRNHLLFDNELPYEVLTERYEEYVKVYSKSLNEYQIAGLDIMSEKEDEFERMKQKQRKEYKSLNIEQFEKEEREKMEWLKKRYPFIIRMVIQKGLFLFSTNYDHSFMENLFLTSDLNEITPQTVKPYQISGAIGDGFNKSRRVIKITFNYKLRKFVREYLEDENVTEDTLFPKEKNIAELEKFTSDIYKDYLNQKVKL